ncbi:hypothetical protein RRG08_042728 [Elysia crispata]|uniref:Uncharacterized protein n=1 Tax=Elysia crispata TaxID=231223 RepID=A0AAE1CK40_9GAST|nr:hypothetical protein RRG08_042728 [Elysia crispata]
MSSKVRSQRLRAAAESDRDGRVRARVPKPCCPSPAGISAARAGGTRSDKGQGPGWAQAAGDWSRLYVTDTKVTQPGTGKRFCSQHATRLGP